MSNTDAARLLLFTVIWAAVWSVPLPRLVGWVELVAGRIPFAAFLAVGVVAEAVAPRRGSPQPWRCRDCIVLGTPNRRGLMPRG